MSSIFSTFMRVVMNTSYKLVLQGLLEMQKWKHGTLLSEKKMTDRVSIEEDKDI